MPGSSQLPGDAGWSAREAARRQREKAERLARSAELWEKGAQGESATASVLATLAPEDYTVFHDLRWPGRRFANVDHVVVGPGGIFVIDSKNWSGTITVQRDVLRQNGRLREREVVGAAESALAVAQMIPSVRVDQVHPVLCFTRDEQVVGFARDVMVCSTSTLLWMLTSRPPVLSTEVRRAAALELDGSLRSMAEPAAYVPARTSRGRVQARPAPTPHRPPVSAAVARKRSGGGLGKLLLALLVTGAVCFALILGAAMISQIIDNMRARATTSVQPDTQGSCPAHAAVKGFTNKAGSQVFLEPGIGRYASVAATVCFADVAAAEAAGHVAAR